MHSYSIKKTLGVAGGNDALFYYKSYTINSSTK